MDYDVKKLLTAIQEANAKASNYEGHGGTVAVKPGKVLPQAPHPGNPDPFKNPPMFDANGKQQFDISDDDLPF